MLDDIEQGIGISLFQQARSVRDALDGEAVSEISAFIRSRQNTDGGFRGRSTESDLYYSFFAISCLLVLGEPLPRSKIEQYLEPIIEHDGLDLVHRVCLVRSRAALRFSKLPDFMRGLSVRSLHQLARFQPDKRSTDIVDALAQTAVGHHYRDVYDLFLLCQALEDFNHELADRDDVIRFIGQFRAEDGAFANAKDMKHGTTTTTAAAVLLLRRWAAGLPEGIEEWLLNQHLHGGGFRASPESPVADLLSTATALTALVTLGSDITPIKERCLEFVETLWMSNGGFKGHPRDGVADCEYTFYGLLALSCLIA